MRTGWLRAAVLGADDAIVSTASLMLGVAASQASAQAILTAGLAGLSAGALSMAVGEFVSVGSQRDAEQADVERETLELAAAPEAELEELARIYQKRGLSKALSREVAVALSAHDRLGAHLHDELGLDRSTFANPFQAAWISAASFASFALVPIAALELAPFALRLPAIAVASLAALAALGALGGHLGGANKARAALRVTVGGALAMSVTAGLGRLLGHALS
jgi:VIT1/CCC1 family predicted Fe2+/Mn2+ transporter